MIYNGNGYNFSTPLHLHLKSSQFKRARGEKVFFGHGGIRRYSNVFRLVDHLVKLLACWWRL